MVRQFPATQQQCPCTLKAKDTRKPPSSSNSAPPPSKYKPKHQNRKQSSKHTKREKRHPTLLSWHHSEQPTQSKRLSPAHPTKRLAKLGSTQTQHQPPHSTTGLLTRTKQASRNMRRYRCVRLREIQVSK